MSGEAVSAKDRGVLTSTSVRGNQTLYFPYSGLVSGVRQRSVPEGVAGRDSLVADRAAGSKLFNAFSEKR